MKKLVISTLILVASSLSGFAQTAKLDSIFTSDGLILANVKEITPELVKYALPELEITNSIEKSTVRKIHFKVGQIEQFSDALILNHVASAYEFEKVGITHLLGETKGLIKLDTVFADYFTTTNLSDINTAINSTIQRSKIQAAMLGGNLLYVINQSEAENQAGRYFNPGYDTHYSRVRGGNGGYTSFTTPIPPRPILSYIVLTDSLPKMKAFKNVIGDKTVFKIYASISIAADESKIKEKELFRETFFIDKLYEENGFIYVTPKDNTGFGNHPYKVVSFDENTIILARKNKDRIYNLFLKP